MPVFKSRPSSSLFENVRKAVAASRQEVSPLDEIQAQRYGAETQRMQALAEKARLEVEQMHRANAARASPERAAEYAGNVAGMNEPDSQRLSQSLRGILEQPGTADYEDASIVGQEAQPFPTVAPSLAPGQQRTFQGALAALQANLLATGNTNAEQLTAAGGNLQQQGLRDQAANAPDVETANRLIAANRGLIREPYSTNAQGTVLNQETGDLAEEGQLAGAVRALAGARAGTEASRAGAYDSQAGLADVRARQLPREVTSRVERNDAAAARSRLPPAARAATAVAPERITRMIDMSAQNEYKSAKAAWDALPVLQRKSTPAPTMASVRAEVEKRYRSSPAAAEGGDDLAQARDAIARGADPEAVRARYRQRTGLELVGLDDEDEEGGY